MSIFLNRLQLGYDQRFAFDPRYGHSRLAEFDTVRGQITDIKKERVLVCSNHTLKTKVYRVEYTNDGHLIIVLCTRKNFFPTIKGKPMLIVLSFQFRYFNVLNEIIFSTSSIRPRYYTRVVSSIIVVHSFLHLYLPMNSLFYLISIHLSHIVVQH